MNRHAIEQAIPYNLDAPPLSEEYVFDDDLRVLAPGKYNRLMNGGDFMVQIKVDGDWIAASGSKLIQIVGAMVELDPEWCRRKLGTALAMIDSGRIDLETLGKVPGGPYVVISPRHLLKTVMLLVVHERRRRGKESLLVKLMLGVIYNEWDVVEASMAYKSGEGGLRAMRAGGGREPSYSDILGVAT